ncbi:carboxypeptidase regulatory-like domain-containing protein [Hymenobacter rubripertinctus]|uniref:Carboxypeptidase-like regulatory domain-containing protein n=1 Tax=Hymenobacter rubripertinctus TaxID=2029981 RepID=A0A418R6Y7_9BACT|nr:carboxypeptidase regulatory-like domain-containing protein [Hymenobacter rubripertinctus]RIY13051.1 carboxypeptidase-like regulatory domain-containing protein [Hymenobacter rubripertinctus]
MPTFSVPEPCPQPWSAMTPTAAGRFCGSCQHEVVDFSAMTKGEVRAWLARPDAGRVCGFFRAGQFAPPPAAPRWRRWLLTGLALLSLKPLLTSCQTAKPDPNTATASIEQTDELASAPQGQVTIRGRVLDDSTGRAVAGAEIFLADTPYGAVTDEQGNFLFTMRQQWEAVRNGAVSLRVSGSPFVFEAQTLSVPVSPAPAPLLVRLKSRPGRGQIMGRLMAHEPPRKPPL